MKKTEKYVNPFFYKAIIALLAALIFIGFGYAGYASYESRSSQTEMITSQIIELSQLMNEHQGWTQSVSNAVLKSECTFAAGDIAASQCPLSDWIAGSRKNRLVSASPAIAPALQQMQINHLAMHEAGIQINGYLAQGDADSRHKAMQVYKAQFVPAMMKFQMETHHLLALLKDCIRKNSPPEWVMVGEANWLLFCLAALCIVLFLAMKTVRFSLAVRKMASLIDQMANGGQPYIKVSRKKDEIGQLRNSVNRLSVYLKEIAGIADDNSDEHNWLTGVRPQHAQSDLRQLIMNLKERRQQDYEHLITAVAILKETSHELSLAAGHYAAGTDQEAAAVADTIFVIHNVKETASVSSEMALEIADIAKQAVEVSQVGSNSVGETIRGMRQIKEQMKSIAGSVLRLSEHNQTISEIIAAVEEIADQSNLLAVNASIEAVSAGEQGKGFAIVAQEVKTLAEQSKEATTQVRTILNEVQKATAAAVMATEQGNKAVDAGVRQSLDAGESIQQIARAIEEASAALMKIIMLTNDQVSGIDRVNDAMGAISHTAGINLDNARHLEMEMQNLEALLGRLKTMLDA